VDRLLVQGALQIDGIRRVAGVGIGNQRRQWAAGGVDRQDRRGQRIDSHPADLPGQRPGLAQHRINAAGGALDRRVRLVLGRAVAGHAEVVRLLCGDAGHGATARVIEQGAGRGRTDVDRQHDGRFGLGAGHLGGAGAQLGLLCRRYVAGRMACGQ
jgi:hypothetical protein